MLGILFILTVRAIKDNDTYYIFSIFAIVLIFEANNNIFPFSTVIFFIFLYYTVALNLQTIIICNKCIFPIYIVITYAFFYIAMFLVSFIFDVPSLEFTPILLLHIFFEILITLIFFKA
jgi:hypothetical protein